MSYIINKFIKKSGEYNYACVVMIINNDIYANPGIILSESLRKIGFLSDLVAIVDDKISNETIKLLKNFFNKIINIKTIEINHNSSIQKVILTKINVYNLIEYDKILLIDADTIFFTNPDKLFLELSEKNKDKIFMPDINNYGFILIEPSIESYNKCIKIISENKTKIKTNSKPFKYVLNKLYDKSNFIKIDFKISYDKYEDKDCIQYRKDKPFLMSGNLTIEERQKSDHFKIWFIYLTNILNKYPEIKEFNCVNETMEVSKYFLSSLSRYTINFVKSNKVQNNKLLNIKNIYGNEDYKKIDYYHLNITKEYTNKFIKYNVDTYDIKSFLEYLDLELIKNKNLKLFENYYKYKSTQKLISKLVNDDINLLYLFLNNYLKMIPNTFATMEIYSISEVKKQNIPIDLKNNLIFSKEYKLSNIQTKNIIFNLYQNFTYNQRIKDICKKIKKSEYLIIISVYELITSIIDFDKNLNLDLFIFYEQGSKIRLSSIFFNPNSIEQYNNQSKQFNIFNVFNSNEKNIILNLNQIINILYLQTLKKYIYSMYSGDEINNLGILFENINKIILIDNNKHSIYKIKYINSNKIFFINIIFSNSSQYKNIIKEKKIKINKIYNINSYWEYEGIKILIKDE